VAGVEKPLERLRRRPPVASFADVQAVLEAHGWAKARQESSHVSFTKPGERTLVVPLAKRKVKRYVVDQVLQRLGLDDE
jgi:predicted RNA binding protein YcfA (HicA-like mRNA interferase family)